MVKNLHLAQMAALAPSSCAQSCSGPFLLRTELPWPLHLAHRLALAPYLSRTEQLCAADEGARAALCAIAVSESRRTGRRWSASPSSEGTKYRANQFGSTPTRPLEESLHAHMFGSLMGSPIVIERILNQISNPYNKSFQISYVDPMCCSFWLCYSVIHS